MSEGRASYDVAMPTQATERPSLSEQAVKLARRLDSLPDACAYLLTLVKDRAGWKLAVQNAGKIETIK